MFTNAKKIKCILVAGLIVFTGSSKAGAVVKTQKVKSANELYQKGEYLPSVNMYKQILKNDAESDIINFNIGTAYYKNGDYAEAVDHLQKSVLTDNDRIRQQAFYNLGNALYRLGQQYKEEEVSKTIELYKQALKEYQKSLKLAKEDANSKFNYDFVKKELEKLQQEQQQQQSQQSPQDQQNNDQKQQEQQNQSDQSKSDDQKNDQNNKQQEQNNNRDNQQQNQQDGKEDQQQNNQQNQDNQQNPSQNDLDKNDQNNNQDQESNQDQQNQQDKQNQQNQQQDQRQDQQEDSQQTSPQTIEQHINAEQLTNKEAQMLLQNYQQTIEPKGLLNFNPKINVTPVLKDW